MQTNWAVSTTSLTIVLTVFTSPGVQAVATTGSAAIGALKLINVTNAPICLFMIFSLLTGSIDDFSSCST
jgi:hypothetical protein